MTEERQPDRKRGDVAFIFAIIIGLAIGIMVKRIKVGILIGIVLGFLIILTGWLRVKKK
jgi:hypothetical protein